MLPRGKPRRNSSSRVHAGLAAAKNTLAGSLDRLDLASISVPRRYCHAPVVYESKCHHHGPHSDCCERYVSPSSHLFSLSDFTSELRHLWIWDLSRTADGGRAFEVRYCTGTKKRLILPAKIKVVEIPPHAVGGMSHGRSGKKRNMPTTQREALGNYGRSPFVGPCTPGGHFLILFANLFFSLPYSS